MVRVADVAAHRQAEQFAAKVVLEPSPDDLLAIVEIFRTDEADNCIDQQGLEVSRDAISPRLHRLLIDAKMRVRG